ncbi:MAG: ATP-binding protein [Bacteroidota bacterium]
MLSTYIDIEYKSQLLVMASKLNSVESVDLLLRKVQLEYQISDELLHDIWVVLNEAVTNAIKYGNKLDSNKKVRLSFDVVDEKNLCFKVQDEGEGFRLEDVPDPTSPERIHEANGRGIYLMKKLATKLEYLNNGNTVCVYFAIS